MKVNIFKPSNLELQKYIECFYILTHSSKTKTTYLTFPSIFSIVSITKNIRFNRKGNIINIYESTTNNFLSDLETQFRIPLLIQYKGNIKEITTYFKPVGLNRFLTQPLSFYSLNKDLGFIPYPDYIDKMKNILNIQSNKEAINNLESYWLSKLNNAYKFEVENAVNEITYNPNTSISLLAKKNNFSHKNLITHFNKHLCRTPTEFRKIVRFRKSIKNKQIHNLTELSYMCNYFDQAHMIKDFQNLTKHNPKEFFKNLTSIDDKIFWVFTKR